MDWVWVWTGISIVFYIAITIIQKIVYKKKGIEMKKETKSKKEKADYNENM